MQVAAKADVISDQRLNEWKTSSVILLELCASGSEGRHKGGEWKISSVDLILLEVLSMSLQDEYTGFEDFSDPEDQAVDTDFELSITTIEQAEQGSMDVDTPAGTSKGEAAETEAMDSASVASGTVQEKATPKRGKCPNDNWFKS